MPTRSYLPADNRFAFVADLGWIKCSRIASIPSQGTFAPNDPPYTKVSPGSGPRHLRFTPTASSCTQTRDQLRP